MFTGIVEGMGIVRKIDCKKNLMTMSISAPKILKGAKPGDSVCFQGVCLTVTMIQKSLLSFDIMKETIDKTSLKYLKPFDKVNLERSLTPRSRFDGHFVTGHIDDVGKVSKKIQHPNYLELQISIPRRLRKYVIPKGSVGVDGVSLTVGPVRGNCFSIFLIPYTIENTTLGILKAGDPVNIETDILAKYCLQ